MKKLVLAFILSLSISFMFWIYEPITMYANNINDLWFSFDSMIGPLIIIFLITFILLLIIYYLIYLINIKFFNKVPLYKISIVISFIVFLALYIQGNYLSYNLPALDGSTIVWSNYKVDSIISICLWLVIIVLMIILIKKFKYEKIENVIKYITLSITAMLFVSLISTMFTTNILNTKKTSYIYTMDNFNDASTDKNFYLFMVDSVDAMDFNNIIKRDEYKNTFQDFSFFIDTVSGYGFTRDSVPFILSGVWNENKTDFLTYYNQAMDKSPLIDNLDKRKYNINLYDMENYWNTNKVKVVNNSVNTTVSIGKKIFYRQEAKYLMYKYLPFFLKKNSLIETMDFNRCKNVYNYKLFDWNNNNLYNIFKNEKINKIDNKNFNFMHIEGAHVPLDMDENLNRIENGTYEQKIIATIKLIDKFINRLKENNVYDNSVVIVLSDHGFNYNDFQGRQNPMLLIKGIDEHHDMTISDVPVSHEYLQDAYVDLMDGKKSSELFKNIDTTKPRRYLWYWLYKENHMVEYEQFGKAWDEETLKPTGKEFNR